MVAADPCAARDSWLVSKDTNPHLIRKETMVGSMAADNFRTFRQVVRPKSAKLLSLVRIQQGAHYQRVTATRPAAPPKSLNINSLHSFPKFVSGTLKTS